MRRSRITLVPGTRWRVIRDVWVATGYEFPVKGNEFTGRLWLSVHLDFYMDRRARTLFASLLRKRRVISQARGQVEHLLEGLVVTVELILTQLIG